MEPSPLPAIAAVAAASPAPYRRVRLRRIHPITCGKVCAGLYGLGALLFVPFALIGIMISLASGAQAQSASTPAFSPILMMFLCFALPFFYALMGFVAGAIGALVYNVVARFLGGIELDVDLA